MKTSSWNRPATGLLLAIKHADLDEANALLMAEIARETATSDTPIRTAKGATAGGDGVKLRGIPAVGGRGSIGGAMLGTKPGQSRLFR